VGTSATVESVEGSCAHRSEPRLGELRALVLMGAVVFIAIILQFRDYRAPVNAFGDSVDRRKILALGLLCPALAPCSAMGLRLVLIGIHGH
jgi:hypothetical protein